MSILISHKFSAAIEATERRTFEMSDYPPPSVLDFLCQLHEQEPETAQFVACLCRRYNISIKSDRLPETLTNPAEEVAFDLHVRKTSSRRSNRTAGQQVDSSSTLPSSSASRGRAITTVVEEPVVVIPASESGQSAVSQAKQRRKTTKHRKRPVQETFFDKLFRSMTYATSKPLLTLGNIADSANASDPWENRAGIQAFMDLFEDPFRGLNMAGMDIDFVIGWMVQPVVTQTRNILHLSLRMHRRALVDVALLVHENVVARKQKPSLSTDVATRQSDGNSAENNLLRQQFEESGLVVPFLNHNSDFTRAANAGALFKAFPALMRVEFSSIVTLGARHRELTDSWKSVKWIVSFLSCTNPRPAMWSAEVLLSRNDSEVILTTQIPDHFTPFGEDRFVASSCIYCATAHRCVRNVEAFPGICVKCAKLLFLVKIRHTGTTRGRGLFAAAEIPSGIEMFEYEGELMNLQQLTRRYGSDCTNHRISPYVMQIRSQNGAVDSNIFIDARRYRGLAAFINHSETPNCAYTYRNGRVFVTTVEDIDEDDELLVSYGNDVAFDNGDPLPLDEQFHLIVDEQEIMIQ